MDEYEYQEKDIHRKAEFKNDIRQKGMITTDNFQKNYAYFARKGFSSNLILQLLKKYKQ